MPDHWEFKSHTYDNCNCAVNCGCQFQLPSTYGHCQTAYVGTIAEGYFNDTPLAGLNWAGLYMWPGEIAEGNGKRQIVIDEGADEAQRIALETIISGEACAPLSNHFSVFGSLCSEFCETLFLPIDLEANFELRTARVDIPGVMKSSGRPEVSPHIRAYVAVSRAWALSNAMKAALSASRYLRAQPSRYSLP